MALQLLLAIQIGKTVQRGRHSWVLLDYSADYISKSVFMYLSLSPRQNHLNYGFVASLLPESLLEMYIFFSSFSAY